MRRSAVRPFGVSVRPTRLLSMLAVIVLLGVMYERTKDPAMWQRLLDLNDEAPLAIPLPQPQSAPFTESITPGPNDTDESEVAASKELFELVVDRMQLKPREMHAYWRLMTWSRTQPFESLKQRALKDVPFTQLWEQPERYRGKPISLRLHVRRVLKYDAPPNPQELPHTYEAWGWTDESRSFPYVVVFSECPEGLPIGTDVRGEVEFVGYFLKVMSYTAFDTARGAPLLVGRVRNAPSQKISSPAKPDTGLIISCILGGIALVAICVWMQMKSRTVVRPVTWPGDAKLNDGHPLFVVDDPAVPSDVASHVNLELDSIGSGPPVAKT